MQVSSQTQNVELKGGRTHMNELLPERLPIARIPHAQLLRLALRHLVLPHDHRLVEGARIHDDARDPGADVIEVRTQVPVLSISVDRPRVRFGICRSAATEGQRKAELQPRPNVDDGVADSELFDVLPDPEFL